MTIEKVANDLFSFENGAISKFATGEWAVIQFENMTTNIFKTLKEAKEYVNASFQSTVS